MKPRPPADRHVESRAALDYLDGTLDASGRREVEAHLGTPCPACREGVRELGALIHLMRLDRVPPVPAALHARALAAFAPGERPAPERATLAQVARLLFDSWAAPLPAAARRAVGEARLLRFEVAGGTLELECETESAGLATMRGRLAIEDAPLHRVVVALGAETRAVWADADGSFAFDRIPAGEARIRVEGPGSIVDLPPFTL
jgi:anti-sigma factor RsiW